MSTTSGAATSTLLPDNPFHLVVLDSRDPTAAVDDDRLDPPSAKRFVEISLQLATSTSHCSRTLWRIRPKIATEAPHRPNYPPQPSRVTEATITSRPTRPSTTASFRQSPWRNRPYLGIHEWQAATTSHTTAQDISLHSTTASTPPTRPQPCRRRPFPFLHQQTSKLNISGTVCDTELKLILQLHHTSIYHPRGPRRLSPAHFRFGFRLHSPRRAYSSNLIGGSHLHVL